jgi:ligand-binding sensor domain-containing protein
MNLKLINRFIPKIIIFSYLLFTAYNALHAQSVRYEIEEIPYAKELEGFIGTSILQDSDGFMWFGSDLGLLRYDGINFKRYVYDPLSKKDTTYKSTGLISDRVSSLIEDSEGTLWFINSDVLMCFKRKTETFIYFRDTCYVGRLWCVVEGKDGYLWVGSGLIKKKRHSKITSN